MEASEIGFIAVQDNEWRTINLMILEKNWMADFSTVTKIYQNDWPEHLENVSEN
jgi:hypothetical protein